jgi:hypothetical protein
MSSRGDLVCALATGLRCHWQFRCTVLSVRFSLDKFNSKLCVREISNAANIGRAEQMLPCVPGAGFCVAVQVACLPRDHESRGVSLRSFRRSRTALHRGLFIRASPTAAAASRLLSVWRVAAVVRSRRVAIGLCAATTLYGCDSSPADHNARPVERRICGWTL